MTSLRISLIAAALIAASTSIALATSPADGPNTTTGNHGAPLPIVGAGLPLLAAGGAVYAIRKRFRKGN